MCGRDDVCGSCGLGSGRLRATGTVKLALRNSASVGSCWKLSNDSISLQAQHVLIHLSCTSSSAAVHDRTSETGTVWAPRQAYKIRAGKTPTLLQVPRTKERVSMELFRYGFRRLIICTANKGNASPNRYLKNVFEDQAEAPYYAPWQAVTYKLAVVKIKMFPQANAASAATGEI